MQLKDSFGGILLYRPRACDDYLTWVSQCELTDSERDAILRALLAFDFEIKANPPKVSPLPLISVIITDREELTLSFADTPSVLGITARLIVLPMHRLRIYDNESLILELSLIEELCHSVYLVDDERLVQDYVVNCFRHLEPNIRREDLYKT